MRLKVASGEIILALVFVGVGAFWIVTALRLPLWDGFAPSSGFLPLIFGALLVGLSMAALLLESDSAGASRENAGTVRRPLVVVAALAAGVAGLELVGFSASMFLVMFFLFKAVERLPLLPSVLVSSVSTIALTLIFRTWLGVPLPKGPWGF